MLCVFTVGTAVITIIKKYSKLIQLPTFEDRYRYLKLDGNVGQETFGNDRYLNQILYHSPEWKQCRKMIILRDRGQDLGCEGFEIFGKILIHHLNPITVEDILNRNPSVFDPENLICVSHDTHNAIHYGDVNLMTGNPIERSRYDTCPWKKQILNDR